MNKRLILILHIIFWITYTGFLAGYLLIESNFDTKYTYFTSIVSIRRVYDLFIFYYFYITVSPKLFGTKRIVLYILLSLLYILILAIPFMFMTVYSCNRWHVAITDFNQYYRAHYFSLLYHAFLIIPFGIAFKLMELWYNTHIKQRDLKAQNDANELALLRAQINPHFLFNTLNNINSFIQREPDKASFGVIKLSEIMRYMLYKSDTDKVFLKDEIGHINNYIELQKLRIKETGFVVFNIYGNYNNVSIPPMLFMPFVENAFKHGRKRDVSPGITINLNILKNSIEFSVINYIKEGDKIDNTKGGFGLKNIKRRLELLFGNNYDLKTTVDDAKFIVELKLMINEN